MEIYLVGVTMAQGDQRSKHSRHASRIIRVGASNGDVTSHRDTKLANDEADIIDYIKRILCAQTTQRGYQGESNVQNADSKSLEELLPPLTSSNDVDVQLYAIVAVILNQFVQSWYNRITPDNDFIIEVIKIIAHCTRGVEQRLRHVDLEQLLLDELPAVLIAHVGSMNEHASSRHTSQANQM